MDVIVSVPLRSTPRPNELHPSVPCRGILLEFARPRAFGISAEPRHSSRAQLHPASRSSPQSFASSSASWLSYADVGVERQVVQSDLTPPIPMACCSALCARCLVQGSAQPLRQLHRVIVRPEMKEEQPWLLVQHMGVDRCHLDPVRA